MNRNVAIHRALVIGYGNPLRCDEGIGWHVVRELVRTGVCHEGEVLSCEQLTPEMAEDISRAPFVLFITAVRSGKPGELVGKDISADPAPMSFSQQLTPGAALGLAADLYGECPHAYLLSVCGERFEEGDVLSHSVADVIPEILDQVGELMSVSVPAFSS